MLNVNTSLLSTVSMEDAISGMQYVSLDPDVVIDANETMAEINAIANNINTKITKIEDYDQAKEHLEQILSDAEEKLRTNKEILINDVQVTTEALTTTAAFLKIDINTVCTVSYEDAFTRPYDSFVVSLENVREFIKRIGAGVRGLFGEVIDGTKRVGIKLSVILNYNDQLADKLVTRLNNLSAQASDIAPLALTDEEALKIARDIAAVAVMNNGNIHGATDNFIKFLQFTSGRNHIVDRFKKVNDMLTVAERYIKNTQPTTEDYLVVYKKCIEINDTVTNINTFSNLLVNAKHRISDIDVSKYGEELS